MTQVIHEERTPTALRAEFCCSGGVKTVFISLLLHLYLHRTKIKQSHVTLYYLSRYEQYVSIAASLITPFVFHDPLIEQWNILFCL